MKVTIYITTIFFIKDFSDLYPKEIITIIKHITIYVSILSSMSFIPITKITQAYTPPIIADAQILYQGTYSFKILEAVNNTIPSINAFNKKYVSRYTVNKNPSFSKKVMKKL